MKRIPPVTSGLWPIALFLLVFLAVVPCHGFQLEIEGSKLSIQAHRVPLQFLLKRLAAEHDITLRMDPSINPTVSASFTNRDIEAGLRSILRPHNHILLWKTASVYGQSTSTPSYYLDEIHVFRPGEKSRMIEITTPPKQAAKASPPPVETSVIIKGNKVFVPVTLTYGDNEVQTTLLFDTGAGSIVLHQKVADELGIDEFEPSRGVGVGGVQITTQKTQLSSVAVGPHKKENLRADIVEFRGPEEAEYNGLLGMNFIRGLKYTIDFENQTIQWTP